MTANPKQLDTIAWAPLLEVLPDLDAAGFAELLKLGRRLRDAALLRTVRSSGGKS